MNLSVYINDEGISKGYLHTGYVVAPDEDYLLKRLCDRALDYIDLGYEFKQISNKAEDRYCMAKLTKGKAEVKFYVHEDQDYIHIAKPVNIESIIDNYFGVGLLLLSIFLIVVLVSVFITIIS